jgi:prepilin-type N-terminal cleavage/methylation domain-containing protein
MSDIRHHRSERITPDCAQAQRAPYVIADLRALTSAECGPESVRGLCRAVALCEGGFTLLELVIVIGIIAILLVLVGPAFTTLTSGTDVSSAIYGVKGVLENARAHAKANHTYVFVGFAEVDSSVDPSVSPQITTGDTPYGRVAMAVVAAKDGTAQYEYATTDQGNDWKANYANGAHLIAVGKLQIYENLHFVPLDFGSWTPTAHPDSQMARYQPTGPPYILSNALSKSVTPFTWPLGSSLDSGY